MLECVRVEGVRAHQAELQAIADANGGIRAAGTPGDDASVDYVVERLEAAGWNVELDEAFILNGIPAGGLFTGAEVPKTAEQAAIWGGTVGTQYDPCYHLACDTFANNNLHALTVNADAVAFAVLTYAYSTESVDGVPGKALVPAQRARVSTGSAKMRHRTAGDQRVTGLLLLHLRPGAGHCQSSAGAWEDRSVRTRRHLPAPVVARRPVPSETPAPSNAVLALQRAAGNRATAKLLQRRTQKGYAGLKLGRNQAGREVEIKRGLGTLGGYEDRLQAVAVARLAGIDRAAVGRDTTGRWHAFELTDDFHGATYAPGAAAALTELYGLPSAAGIATQQTTVANLKAHTGDVAAKLNAATKDLYALILGVDGGEVLLNRSSFDRKAGKINVTTALTKDPGKLGAHGRESQQDESFAPGAKSAFELSPNAFTTAARAQAVLFHEVSHLKDYELTQRWVTEYEKKGRIFVGGTGVTYFQDWLKGRASAAEAQLASDIAAGAQATTEARAYVRTFIAAFDVGAVVEAAAQLVAYAKGMAGGKIPIPAQADKNAVVVELKAELAAYRGRLGRADKKAFDVAVAAAVKENPKSWLAGVKHG